MIKDHKRKSWKATANKHDQRLLLLNHNHTCTYIHVDRSTYYLPILSFLLQVIIQHVHAVHSLQYYRIERERERERERGGGEGGDYNEIQAFIDAFRHTQYCTQ